MNKIQAVIFDVDGTLFDYREHKIHASSILAAKELRAAGIGVIIATGRSYPLLGKHFHDLIPADYYITANGHSILDAEGRELYSKRFTYDQTQYVASLARKYHDGLMLKYNAGSCIYSRQDEMPEIFTEIGPASDTFFYDPDMQYHTSELPLGFTLRGSGGMKQELARFKDQYRVELFHDTTECDVFSPDTNKMTGLSYLSRLLSLNPEHCIAFGDSRNDLEMVRWAGLGIAMGNGCEELKSAADLICPPSWEDGIAHALGQLGAIDMPPVK